MPSDTSVTVTLTATEAGHRAELALPRGWRAYSKPRGSIVAARLDAELLAEQFGMILEWETADAE